MEKKQSNVERRVFSCPLCPKKFTTALALRGHQRGHRQDFTCQFCPRKFSNAQALGGHQKAHKRERELMEETENVVWNYVQVQRRDNAYQGESFAPAPYHPGFGSASAERVNSLIDRYDHSGQASHGLSSPMMGPVHGANFPAMADLSQEEGIGASEVDAGGPGELDLTLKL